MSDDDASIASLRAAIKGRGTANTADEASRFEALARSYEKAVAKLLAEAAGVVRQVGDLTLRLEDEVETSTSPAFPGRSTQINCLIRSREDSEPPYWAYRSSDDLTKFALPFTRNVLVRVLHAVFA
jgi:hypothetical protein